MAVRVRVRAQAEAGRLHLLGLLMLGRGSDSEPPGPRAACPVLPSPMKAPAPLVPSGWLGCRRKRALCASDSHAGPDLRG